MKIIITGASGYVGASIFTNLRNHYEVIGTFHKDKLFEDLLELDVTDKNAVIQIFLTLRSKINNPTASGLT